jgi:hypothetical protein
MKKGMGRRWDGEYRLRRASDVSGPLTLNRAQPVGGRTVDSLPETREARGELTSSLGDLMKKRVMSTSVDFNKATRSDKVLWPETENGRVGHRRTCYYVSISMLTKHDTRNVGRPFQGSLRR